MEDTGKLILRIGMGILMLTHGYPKLIKLFSGGEITFADPFGAGVIISLILAVFAEVICSALIIVGFKTRLACIPLIITMLVVIFVIHSDDPFKRKELAILYAVAFSVIMLLGPGRYSLDSKWSRYQ